MGRYINTKKVPAYPSWDDGKWAIGSLLKGDLILEYVKNEMSQIMINIQKQWWVMDLVTKHFHFLVRVYTNEGSARCEARKGKSCPSGGRPWPRGQLLGKEGSQTLKSSHFSTTYVQLILQQLWWIWYTDRKISSKSWQRELWKFSI